MSNIYVPPLYFDDKQKQQQQFLNNGFDIPVEILSQAMTDFADYGTLARLACACKSYSSLVVDSAVDSFDLAVSYLEGGCGLEKNAKMAVRLLTQMCEANELSKEQLNRAKYLLASCHLSGNGTEVDQEKGLKLLEDAANNSDPTSGFYLARLYEGGEYDVPLCPEKAARWFRHAAELGHIESMAEYALHLELGVGVEQNDSEALNWYVKAAEFGHIEANFSIGECYEEAKGVPHDLNEACLWYFKSAEKGCDDSVKALMRLEDIARIIQPGVLRRLLHGDSVGEAL